MAKGSKGRGPIQKPLSQGGKNVPAKVSPRGGSSGMSSRAKKGNQPPIK